MTGISEGVRAALANRYEIQRELGRGGMAVVYLARDHRHDRLVALKVLRAELSAVVPAERFLREMQIAARFSHPHILPLHDSGEAAGVLYYVMPYVDGEALRSRLDREHQLPVRDALRIAREVADALDYAHRQDVVHRDVKPENILLSDGHAVIADFGIAAAVTASASDRLTATGLTLGTPEYMSPEQVAGAREVDARSDIFSLGCVLYEMLAGEPPFSGSTPQAAMAQRQTRPAPSVRILRPSLSEAIDRTVSTALALAAADRFKTAREFSAALDHASAVTLASAATPFIKTSRRSKLVATLGAILLLAATALVARSSRDEGQALVVESTTQLTHEPGLELAPALSPDGLLVAYASGPGPAHERMEIHVRHVSGGQAVRLLATAGNGTGGPRWSPDGSRIAFHRADGISITPALGGPLTRVVDIAPSSEGGGPTLRPHSPAWSPDGKFLAYALDSAIYVLDIDGRTSRKVINWHQPHSVTWSPDGQWIAFVSDNRAFSLGLANDAPSAICVVRAYGEGSVKLTDQITLNASPVFMPDGRTMLFVSNRGGGRDVYSLRLNGDFTADGEPVRLTTGLDAHSITIAAGGERLAFSKLRVEANVWSVALDSTRTVSLDGARPLTRGNQRIGGVGLSPDGRWLAFHNNIGGTQDIYRMPIDGGDQERLTQDPTNDYYPAWSPDGKEIAFYSTRHGSRDIFVMNADGSAQRRVTDAPGHEFFPAWSPDGRQIVYSDHQQLFLIRRDATGMFGAPRRLTNGVTARIPQWSPDGRWIAYVEGHHVRLVAPTSGDVRTLTVSGTDDPDNENLSSGFLLEAASDDTSRTPHTQGVPVYSWTVQWSPDGKSLFYRTERSDGRWMVSTVPAEGGAARVVLDVADAKGFTAGHFDTDGRRLFTPLIRVDSDVWFLTLRAR